MSDRRRLELTRTGEDSRDKTAKGFWGPGLAPGAEKAFVGSLATSELVLHFRHWRCSKVTFLVLTLDLR